MNAGAGIAVVERGSNICTQLLIILGQLHAQPNAKTYSFSRRKHCNLNYFTLDSNCTLFNRIRQSVSRLEFLALLLLLLLLSLSLLVWHLHARCHKPMYDFFIGFGLNRLCTPMENICYFMWLLFDFKSVSMRSSAQHRGIMSCIQFLSFIHKTREHKKNYATTIQSSIN